MSVPTFVIKDIALLVGVIVLLVRHGLKLEAPLVEPSIAPTIGPVRISRLHALLHVIVLPLLVAILGVIALVLLARVNLVCSRRVLEVVFALLLVPLPLAFGGSPAVLKLVPLALLLIGPSCLILFRITLIARNFVAMFSSSYLFSNRLC